jgi:hypothetical protein
MQLYATSHTDMRALHATVIARIRSYPYNRESARQSPSSGVFPYTAITSSVR